MARLESYGRGLMDSELSARKRDVRQQIESDYTAPAINTGVGYVDEKGRKLVEMQEKMRSAARFT